MNCDQCHQPFQVLMDKFSICGCQDLVAESAAAGQPPARRYRFPAGLRNAIVAKTIAAQHSMSFAQILLGPHPLVMRPQAGPALGIPGYAACGKCARPYTRLFDQFVLCNCSDVIHEDVGRTGSDGKVAFRDHPVSPALHLAIRTVSQISRVAADFSAAISGGRPFDPGSFGVTHFSGRG